MEELLVIFILPSMLSGYSCISIYVKTSKVEVNQIVSKTEESDKIYVQQIELTHKIDSLYKYTTMFNTNLNDGLLLNAVSKRKQDILTDIEKLRIPIIYDKELKRHCHKELKTMEFSSHLLHNDFTYYH